MKCLKCGYWSKDGASTAKKERWCKLLNTWTAPDFLCSKFEKPLMKDQPSEWYTIAEVAEMCHVDPETVRYWIRTERVTAYPIMTSEVRLNGQFQTQWKIDKESADRYAAWYNSLRER